MRVESKVYHRRGKTQRNVYGREGEKRYVPLLHQELQVTLRTRRFDQEGMEEETKERPARGGARCADFPN